MRESTSAPADRREGVTRRGALRAAAGAAGLAAAGAVLAACGTGATGATGAASSSAQPQPQAVTTKILWRPWYNFNNAQSKTGQALMMQGIQPWLAKNPGVEVDITYMGYQGTTVTALLAGSGPDIFADWVLPLYTSSGNNLLLDITKYVRQNNVDLSIFPQRDMASFQVGGGLYALPSYLHLIAPAVNLSVLDGAGLGYPQSGWTYKEWETLYRKATVKSTDPKKKVVGGQFHMGGYDYNGAIPSPFYLASFGGEYVDPSDSSKCYLSNQKSIDCLQWMYQLLWDGACDTGSADFRTGHKAVGEIDTAGALITAATQWGGVKWQVYDLPLGPAGNVTYAASDFYAISAATQNPDLVWDFMNFLCVGTEWQTWMTKLALNGPNQKTLYDQWVTTVKAVAPPLANMDLDVFKRQMDANSPYFGLLFKSADTQAGNAIAAGLTNVQNQKADLTTTVTQVTNQVNALEAAAVVLEGKTAVFEKQFPTTGPAVAGVPTGI